MCGKCSQTLCHPRQQCVLFHKMKYQSSWSHLQHKMTNQEVDILSARNRFPSKKWLCRQNSWTGGVEVEAAALLRHCPMLTASADLHTPALVLYLQNMQFSKRKFALEPRKLTRGSTGQSAPVGRSGTSLDEDLKSSSARCRLD